MKYEDKVLAIVILVILTAFWLVLMEAVYQWAL
jgi:hypothetical protein